MVEWFHANHSYVSDTIAPYTDLQKCDTSTLYRTINGTCNNLYKPWNGAAKTPLTRLTHNKYQDGKITS
mgnify:FL=1